MHFYLPTAFLRETESREEWNYPPQLPFLTSQMHFPYLCFLKMLMHMRTHTHTQNQAFSPRSVPGLIISLPPHRQESPCTLIMQHPWQTLALHHAEWANVLGTASLPLPAQWLFLQVNTTDWLLLWSSPEIAHQRGSLSCYTVVVAVTSSKHEFYGSWV